MNEPGHTVRTRRRKLGLTQQGLADLSGVGVVFVYDLEKGKSTIRLDKLLDVLEALGLQLVVRDGSPTLVSEVS
jgi:y4mF family transcriptional regulator